MKAPEEAPAGSEGVKKEPASEPGAEPAGKPIPRREERKARRRPFFKRPAGVMVLIVLGAIVVGSAAQSTFEETRDR